MFLPTPSTYYYYHRSQARPQARLSGGTASARTPHSGSPQRRHRFGSHASLRLASAEAPLRLALPSHQTQVVDGQPAPQAEDGHDDGQADGHLGGGHGHDEEDERLAVVAAEAMAEGDEGEVGGVQHQLDGHEDHERVAADDHADHADREQRRRQREGGRPGG